MADRPRRGDDDEVPRLPEVTVPPWLRDGTAPGPPDSGVVPGPGAAPGEPGVGEAPSGDDPPGSPSSRIVLEGTRGEETSEAPERGRAPDGLSTLALRPGVAGPGRPAPEQRRPPPRAQNRQVSRPARIAVAAATAVAVLGGSAVLGYFVTRGAVSPSAQATSDCPEVSEPGRVVGAGPGSLETPAGAVLAFDHAYYVERSASKAFEAVASTSRMSEEQLRLEGVERVLDGTRHCDEVREISSTRLEVDLTEYPPDAAPVHIRQRVRVAENPDGTWGIVSITPAG